MQLPNLIYQNCKEFKTKQFVYLQERLGKIMLLLSMRNLSLDKLALLVLASFMHKYHFKKLPKIFDNMFTLVSSIYSRSTRNSSKYQQCFIPQFATNLLQRHIKFRGSKIWNSIPDKLKQQNHKQFKNKYKKLLLTL